MGNGSSHTAGAGYENTPHGRTSDANGYPIRVEMLSTLTGAACGQNGGFDPAHVTQTKKLSEGFEVRKDKGSHW